MKQEVQDVAVEVEAPKEEKKSFRKSNKVTLVLQIIFAVLCAVVLAFEITFTSMLGSDGDGNALGVAIAKVFGMLLLIFPTIVAIILAIPFILLMVFCKRPWIALAAFGALAACTIACWVSMKVVGSQPTEALQFLPMLTAMLA